MSAPLLTILTIAGVTVLTRQYSNNPKSSPQAGACELLSLYFARYCTRYPVRIIRRILCQKV